MNCNGKRMKLEVTRLTKIQRCKIIAKLSKPKSTEQADTRAGVWNQWRCHPESYGNDTNWRTTSMTKSNLLRHLLNLKVLPASKALKFYCPWHWRPIALLQCSNGSWTDVWWTVTIVWDVSTKHNKLTMNVKGNKFMHSPQMNYASQHVQTIKYEPWFLLQDDCRKVGTFPFCTTWVIIYSTHS